MSSKHCCMVCDRLLEEMKDIFPEEDKGSFCPECGGQDCCAFVEKSRADRALSLRREAREIPNFAAIARSLETVLKAVKAADPDGQYQKNPTLIAEMAGLLARYYPNAKPYVVANVMLIAIRTIEVDG